MNPSASRSPWPTDKGRLCRLRSATVDQILSALQSTGLPITDTRTGVTKPRIRLDQALAQLVPSVTVTAVTPNQGTAGASVPVTIDGSGFVSGATVGAGGGITVSSVAFVSATRLTATFTIASGAVVGARNVTVTNPGGGGSGTLTNGFTVNAAGSATVTLVYNGKVRDRVGAGNTALGADGALDGTLTMTLSAAGGRTITALQLQNSSGGTWDTTSSTSHWVLGVASSLDGALLNNVTTMAVNVAVADGGSLVLFGSDYGALGFAPGTTLTVTATFSDGTTATAGVTP